MKPENKNKIFEDLFAILANGSRDEIKEAKKQIEKLWHMNSKLFKGADDFILETIENFDRVKDGEHKAAVLSGMNLFFLALMDKRFNELSQFILKNMEHNDGRVREAARHTASWIYHKHPPRHSLSIFDGKRKISDKQKLKIDQDTKIFEEFIDAIESLIKKHEPVDKPLYISDSPPSIYKSLVFLWHDMSHGTTRDFEHRENLMNPMDNAYIPQLGYDDYEEEVDVKEIEENIWMDKKDGDSREGGKWLKRSEEIAKERFERELNRLKFGQEEIVGILMSVRIHGQESGRYMLVNLLRRGGELGSIIEISDANNLVREMQSFANHRVIKNLNGPISHLLVEAIVERECSCVGKPDNLATFVKLICQSHECIDEFLNKHEQEEKERFLEIIGFIKKIKRSTEDEKKSILEYQEKEKREALERYWARSVAHHTLDWYIQANPRDFNRINDPRKVAAYILFVVKDYNAEITDGEILLSYDKKELSVFGGWKGAESFSAADYKITRPVLDMVGDRDLLLIDPAKSKKSNDDGGGEIIYDDYKEKMTMEKIIERRKEIDQELLEALKKAKSDFGLDDVKDAIYNEEGSNGMMKIVVMFDESGGLSMGRGENLSEFNGLLKLISDAWNYFPHKNMGGISPAEKLLEYQQNE